MDMSLTLTTDMALVLGLLVFTVLMLVLEWVRGDLVALLVIVVIGVTRLMPVEQLFDGFAGNAVMSLIAVMIMGAGLDRTGLLSDVTGAISDLSLNIASAHITTFGEKIIDTFYVTDLVGHKITDPARQKRISKRIVTALLKPPARKERTRKLAAE